MLSVVGNLGEMTERDAGDAIERAAQAQLREHAIEAIHRFVDVLEDENRVVEVWHERRANECRQHGEIAARETAASPTPQCRTSASLAVSEIAPLRSPTAAESDALLNSVSSARAVGP